MLMIEVAMDLMLKQDATAESMKQAKKIPARKILAFQYPPVILMTNPYLKNPPIPIALILSLADRIWTFEFQLANP
jgi:hypothetical protein